MAHKRGGGGGGGGLEYAHGLPWPGDDELGLEGVYLRVGLVAALWGGLQQPPDVWHLIQAHLNKHSTVQYSTVQYNTVQS